MQTVTTAEACESLSELLMRIDKEPVLIRDGEQDVAVLVSPKGYEEAERQRKIEHFNQIRKLASEELRINLAKEGLTIDEFLADLLGT